MMDRDTFSHIGLWCPRPFGSYSQNKGTNLGTKPTGKGSNEVDSSSLCKVEPSSGGRVNVEEQEEKEVKENVDLENTPPPTELEASFLMQTNASAPPGSSSSPNSSEAQMEDGRVLLDTWYVIKPGNTKEKIAFFVAHQFSGANQPRPSAVKVKGNWATDCSKAKRRRRCSTNDTPTHAHASKQDLSQNCCNAPSSCDQSPPQRGKQTDLLSVAEMIALVEQRTAMALQGIVAAQRNQLDHKSSTNQNPGLAPNQHTLLHGTGLDPTSMLVASESSNSDTSIETWDLTDKDLEVQQESCRVAKAIAHFEAQNMENQLNLDGSSADSLGQDRDKEMGVVRESGPVTTSPTGEGRDEVRIAFRVSNLDSRSQESAGRSRCVFMSCGGGANYAPARAKEKITCDLYQLLTPSLRDPNLLLAASTSAPKLEEEQSHANRNGSGSPERMQEKPLGEKKADGVKRDLVTGFHVEVVVTGAVDQCVFYGKDSKEKVQGKTVCFVMPNGGGGGNGVETSNEHLSDDPLPGQLFLLQPPREAEADAKALDHSSGSGLCSLDCVNKTGPVVMTVSSGERSTQPNSPGFVEDCSDPSLCRLYRHVSHDFLEIRFQIQQLLEPRQYMLLLPDHIMVNIFSYLPTHSLAALKCTCHYFKMLIETYGVRAVDSRWNQDPLYRDDPCKQCKRQYECGDVSLCRWHPKPYHHDLPYGRSYWMCCRRTDKDTPGCRIGLHDNNWVQQRVDGSESICTKREERREEAR